MDEADEALFDFTTHGNSKSNEDLRPARCPPQLMRRLIWIIPALLMVLGAEGALSLLKSPGWVIRRELRAAGAEIKAQLVPLPSPALRQAIRRHFHEGKVEVDTNRFWPNVAVTVRGVPRGACADATREARRIDGLVVIQLQDYRAPADCQDRNDMTWWIMP